MTKLKNSIKSFKSRPNHTEKRISNLKDKTFDVTESEKQKEKRMRKEWRKTTGLKEQEKTKPNKTSCTVGISEGGEREKYYLKY